MFTSVRPQDLGVPIAPCEPTQGAPSETHACPQEGYAAKFRRLADPGGRAQLGFRRTAARPQTLEVDPSTVGHAVGLFERCASGAVSIDQLATEHGMNDRRLNDILKNPIYNGWVTRKGERSPAASRESPPVDDELWAPRSPPPGRPHPRRWTSARTGSGPAPGTGALRLRLNHPGSRVHGWKAAAVHAAQPCPEGVTKKIWDGDTLLTPLEAQISGLRLDDEVTSSIVAALAEPEASVVPIDLGRFLSSPSGACARRRGGLFGRACLPGSSAPAERGGGCAGRPPAADTRRCGEGGRVHPELRR